jgi:hypothetical protein
LRTTPRHALQRFAAADDAIEVVVFLALVAEIVELVAQALELERLLDLDFHLLELERLLHVVERAKLHRLDGRRHRTERGHQDHRRGRVQGLRGAEHVEAVGAAHLEVAHHDVEVALVKALERRVAVAGLVDLVPGGGQRQRQPPPESIVIVRYKYASHVPCPISAYADRQAASP